jgi:hypothetical protein
MAAGVGAGGRGGLGCQASSRPAAQADRATRRAMAATVAARSQGVWLPERAMDLEAHGHGDLAGVPSTLSPLARVEGVAALAVEWSGTGTPGPPARRTGDRPLEALPVASHQKKSEDLAPISRSSTKAAVCSSPRVIGPGRLRDRRRSSSLATHMTASQRWPPSPCRRSVSTWDCLSASSRPTSPRFTWRLFCGGCYTLGGATSSSSGIRARFTRGLRSRRSSEPTPASILKSCRPRPPNSIRSSNFGTTSKATRRIACRVTRGTSAAACRPTLVEFGGPRRNCARSSWLLACLLHREKTFIIYAKLNKTVAHPTLALTGASRCAAPLLKRTV